MLVFKPQTGITENAVKVLMLRDHPHGTDGTGGGQDFGIYPDSNVCKAPGPAVQSEWTAAPGSSCGASEDVFFGQSAHSLTSLATVLNHTFQGVTPPRP